MSAFLQEAALWTWQNSLAAAVLVLVIAGMRRIFRGRVAPLWLCLAGWLVLVRLWLPAPLPNAWAWDRAWNSSAANIEENVVRNAPSIPPITATELSAGELRAELATAKGELERALRGGFGPKHPKVRSASHGISEREQVLAALPAAPPPPVEKPVDWVNILTWVWFAGVAAFSLHTIVAHRRFVRRLSRNAKPLELPWPGLAAECAATAGLRSAPPLLAVPGSGTPFLCGLFRPRIILPSATLEALTLSESRHVLLHEMLHIRRRDLAANWLLAAVRALHWFNPLVHLACRRLLADRELLRDHQAIALLRDPAEREAYGRTLLKLALPLSAPAPSPGLAPFFRSEKELKRRLTMIQSPLRHHRLAATFAALTLTSSGLVLFTTARGQEKPVPVQPAGSSDAAAGAAPVAAEVPVPAAPAAPSAGAAPAAAVAPSEPVAPAVPVVPRIQVTPADPARPSGTAIPVESSAAVDLDLPRPASTSAVSRVKVSDSTPSAKQAKASRAAVSTTEASPDKTVLRDIAAKLRAEGRMAEADAIEEALKKFPAAPSADVRSIGKDLAKLKAGMKDDAELQQLRAEMAEAKAAIASIKQLTGPRTAEEKYDELLKQLKSAMMSGFGPRHPKMLSLKNAVHAEKEAMELKAKAELDAAAARNAVAAQELERIDKRLATAAAADKATADNLKAKAEALKKMSADLRKVADEEAAAARKAEPVKDTDQAGDNLPWGVALPGRNGLAYSPYTPERSVVDVSGFKKGSKVKCPYTGNFFQVP